MKIPLLYEINPFDNSVNPYSSISGHTFENWSCEKPDLCNYNFFTMYKHSDLILND